MFAIGLSYTLREIAGPLRPQHAYGASGGRRSQFVQIA
jgi:hypothetical protein